MCMYVRLMHATRKLSAKKTETERQTDRGRESAREIMRENKRVSECGSGRELVAGREGEERGEREGESGEERIVTDERI
jgi:hypothetical protein